MSPQGIGIDRHMEKTRVPGFDSIDFRLKCHPHGEYHPSPPRDEGVNTSRDRSYGWGGTLLRKGEPDRGGDKFGNEEGQKCVEYQVSRSENNLHLTLKNPTPRSAKVSVLRW